MNADSRGGPAYDRLVLQIIPGICLAGVFFHLGYVAAGGPVLDHVVLLVLGLAAYGLGFTAAAAAFATRPWWATRILPALCFTAFVMWLGISHLVSTAVVSPQFERYQSDSLAFDAYSAQLVIQGKDPYAVSMAPSATAFNVSPPIYTPTVEGGRVSVEPYPALSFLVYVPFVMAHVQSMIWVDIGFALAAMLLVLLLVPERTRVFFGLFFLLIPEFRDFAVGSVTDVVWLPLMIGVAATWERSPPWSAILLGLACAVKQEPWFIVPFALVHWWQTNEPGGAPAAAFKNLALLTAAFLAPNLVFVAWHPGQWLAGVLSPLLSHAVPLGSGLIQLQTSGLLALPLRVYTILWVSALVVCLAAYARWPQRLAWLPFIAPAIVLFFSPRSLQNYFIYWPLVLAVYAATATMQREAAPLRVSPALLKRAVAVSAAVVAILVLLAGVAAAGGPMTMTVKRVAVDPDTGYVDRVVLDIRNPSSRPHAFHFALSNPYNAIVFWRPDRFDVPAHAERTIELSPADLSDEVPPSPIAGLQVVAFAPQDEIAVYTRPLSQSADTPHPLRNGRLIAAVNKFQMLPVPSPLAWTAPPQPFLDGRLAMVSDGPFGRALRLRLTPSARSEWNVVRVSQAFTMNGSRFTFWLKPSCSDDSSSSPAQLFAIAFTDASGRRTYYVVNASIKQPTRLQRDRDTYVELPGRIGVWNRYTVDLDPARASPRALIPIGVALVGAVRHDYRGAAGGEFGGILEN
ncbi:MAG TPA: hypothetical protein VKF82_02345 [Candidatus Eremiobacteraceae bacterium]|nr:hypothetical protein [Candidatus Eremiobacteraceae bacterium]